MQVFLGLGSNVGECEHNLKTAVHHLTSIGTVVKQSSFYWTEPQYITDQPRFLNQVIEIDTLLSSQDLLRFLKDTERHMGRQPTRRYGPRLIDIDILYYGQEIIETPTLIIPHPEIPKREFVLGPLHEIAANFICPLSKKSIQELYLYIKKQ